MRFEIKHLDIQNQVIRTTFIEGQSDQDAIGQAQLQDAMIVSVKSQRQWRDFFTLHTQHRNYPLFCRELRTLMGAGMGVVEAINTLCNFDLQGRNVSDSGVSIARPLLKRLEQGQLLSSALSELPDVPLVLLSSIRSVEHTSNLLEALDDYLQFDDMLSQLRRKVISAAIYPVLVSLLGLLITLFLMMVVMPQFAAMYKQLRTEAHGLTKWVIELSLWMSTHQLFFGLCVVAAMAFLLLWIRSGKIKLSLMSWGWRVQWIRSQIIDYQLTLFYQTLHLLTKGGYALVPSLRIASTASLSPLLCDHINRCLHDLEQGKGVSHCFHLHGLANEVDRRLLAASEDAGDFHSVAHAIGQLHQKRFETLIERLTRIAEPVMLLLVALLLGTVVVVMYLPVFEMGVLNR